MEQANALPTGTQPGPTIARTNFKKRHEGGAPGGGDDRGAHARGAVAPWPPLRRAQSHRDRELARVALSHAPRAQLRRASAALGLPASGSFPALWRRTRRRQSGNPPAISWKSSVNDATKGGSTSNQHGKTCNIAWLRGNLGDRYLRMAMKERRTSRRQSDPPRGVLALSDSFGNKHILAVRDVTSVPKSL